MKEIMDNLVSLLLFLAFVVGYFPVNMILAFIYGDKVDVVISFFIPFYGLFVFFGS
ncbi:MAG: hypothetical protein V7688_09685 [Alcanivorax jadensis]|uniref:hypothetical protein n=1 Tax=Alcanivorax jadensis TaxID=64988 RepID=UPI0030037CC5